MRIKKKTGGECSSPVVNWKLSFAFSFCTGKIFSRYMYLRAFIKVNKNDSGGSNKKYFILGVSCNQYLLLYSLYNIYNILYLNCGILLGMFYNKK